MTNISNYPQHPIDEPLPRYLNIPPPAAGAEIVYACPARHRFKILGFHFVLTASAAAANRNVDIIISQGLTQLYRFDMNLIHTAGFPYGYHLIAGQIQGIFTITLDRFCPAPWPLFLFSGQTLHTETANIQVADQFGVIYLYGFSWPDFVNIPPA